MAPSASACSTLMLASQASLVGTALGPTPRPWAHWSRCGFWPASIDSTRPPPIERDAVRNHLPLRERRAQPPGRGDQHLPVRRPAEAAPGGLRLNQRLDQNGHRGSRRRQAVRLHVAAGARGPQRGPAGAYRGEEFGLVAQAQKALELPGETCVLAVLDERRGANGAERRRRALRPPGVDERLDDRRRDRPLIEREPDLHRQPEAGRKVRRSHRREPRLRRQDGAADDDTRPPSARTRPASASRRARDGRDWRPCRRPYWRGRPRAR